VAGLTLEVPMFDVQSVTDSKPYLGLPGFEVTAEQLARQRPDEMLLVRDGEAVVARCGLWFGRGLVGHYYAASAAAGATVLNAACARLAMEGCSLAVGPMDGNTWERYRLLTERGEEPPFFLEPDNPDDWPGHFAAAGFSPIARYCSAVCEGLSGDVPRLREGDITIRQIDLSRFTDELVRLHRLSLVCFVENLFYTPISEADFLSLYAPARAFVRQELVLLAEKEGELVGFIFAVPDLLQKMRGEAVDSVVVKTMAVHPDHAGRGMGGHLMARVHQAARECGFRRAIHALFHEDNFSGRISRHTARIIRRYELFARPLGGPT
jgi:GNAT superfamily N-acetyltransferase